MVVPEVSDERVGVYTIPICCSAVSDVSSFAQWVDWAVEELTHGDKIDVTPPCAFLEKALQPGFPLWPAAYSRSPQPQARVFGGEGKEVVQPELDSERGCKVGLGGLLGSVPMKIEGPPLASFYPEKARRI